MDSTHFRLTSAERDAVNGEIETLRRMHDQVCASIIEAQHRIHSIELQVLETNFDLTIRRSYLGSMRYVPFEILGHIFQIYIDDNPDHLDARGWLQLVCTKWRDVVLGYPSLWARIDLVGPFHTHQEESYLNYIDMCVLRSGASKLDISFKTYFEGVLGDEYATSRILNYLISYVGTRWRSFKYSQACNSHHLNNEEGLEVLNHVLTNAPNLESVVIGHHANLSPAWLDSREGEGLGSYFQNLKSLRSLQIPADSWYLLVGNITLPQITDLVVEGDIWRGFKLYRRRGSQSSQVWLRQFPCLRSLSLRHRNPLPELGNVSEGPLKEHYPAKSLTHLVLHGRVPSKVLKYIQFPVLQEVIVQANDSGTHLFQRSFDACQMNLEHVPCLRLECQPGKHFWNLGKDYEDFYFLHNEVIPYTFSKFENLKTVYATGCIWRTFAWIFDTWSTEFIVASRRKCQESQGIPMEKVRAALEQKVVGRGENWVPPPHSDDEDENEICENPE
ncbi:hypothetical protein CPB86DRAFT_829560 [Serendipita vermifera]|nr:hypothetical protein CPB86DRAFT_829560 [Serendipita vermifera]